MTLFTPIFPFRHRCTTSAPYFPGCAQTRPLLCGSGVVHFDVFGGNPFAVGGQTYFWGYSLMGPAPPRGPEPSLLRASVRSLEHLGHRNKAPSWCVNHVGTCANCGGPTFRCRIATTATVQHCHLEKGWHMPMQTVLHAPKPIRSWCTPLGCGRGSEESTSKEGWGRGTCVGKVSARSMGVL